MLEHSVAAIVITLASALTAIRFPKHETAPLHFRRVVAASLITVSAVFLSMFVIGGYGWGWPDISRRQELFLLAAGGVSLGLCYSIFAWLASRKMNAPLVLALVIVDGIIGLIPYSLEAFGFLLFSAANFVILFAWLRNA